MNDCRPTNKPVAAGRKGMVRRGLGHAESVASLDYINGQRQRHNSGSSAVSQPALIIVHDVNAARGNNVCSASDNGGHHRQLLLQQSRENGTNKSASRDDVSPQPLCFIHASKNKQQSDQFYSNDIRLVKSLFIYFLSPSFVSCSTIGSEMLALPNSNFD